MAQSLRELRIAGRKAGIPDYRSLDQDELVAALAKTGASTSNGSSSSKAAKAVKKAVVGGAVKKAGRPAKTEEVAAPKRGRGRPPKAEAVAEAPKRRGRPPKAASAPVAKTSAPKAAAKAPKAQKVEGRAVGRPAGSVTGTRTQIADTLNWKADFNFGEGTIMGAILDELRTQAKKHKTTSAIRKATYDALVSQAGKAPFVFVKRDGTKYDKEESRKQLRFRVSYTIFQYAKETGQHEGNTAGSPQPAKAATAKAQKATVASTPSRGRAKAQATTEAPKRRGRPPKAEATAEAPKRRGRPPKSESAPAAAPKRGRPAKAQASEAPKRRGRPPKNPRV